VSLTKRMGDAHEAHIAEVFGYRQTRGSGNQWRDQMDAKGHRMDEAVAFSIDGKSTRAKSIGVKREELDKAIEQAAGERPMMAYRFYDDDRLRRFEDWYLLREDDLLELIERSRRLSELEG
jgi:Holliday junction resolvase